MFRALVLFVTSLMWWQQPPTAPPVPDDPEVEFVCPMDKDVRSKTPGKCPRCGMTLVAGIPDPHEFPVRITTAPKILKPGEETLLTFRVEDPSTGKTVHDFEIMHEKLFHQFLISQDMQFFQHVHPIMQADGTFDLDVKFPHPGLVSRAERFLSQGRDAAVDRQHSVRGRRRNEDDAREADAGPGAEQDGESWKFR